MHTRATLAAKAASLSCFSAYWVGMKLKSRYLVAPHEKIRLASIATGSHHGMPDKAAAEAILAQHHQQLSDLQEAFYASQSKALLIVLQGMDTSGKDGAVRHIFSGINPQGCNVASFKSPTTLELRHDFLWRVQAQVPPRGMIGIFNRSHYEDVLQPRIHGVITAKIARQRLDQINDWEDTLTRNDVVIAKFYLHISEKEQIERLQSRIDSPEKHWKLDPSDFIDRQFWPQYTEAYEDILRHTSHKHAPWFIIPSDHKWFRNIAISTILLDLLRKLNPKYPSPPFDPTGIDIKSLGTKQAASEVQSRAKKED